MKGSLFLVLVAVLSLSLVEYTAATGYRRSKSRKCVFGLFRFGRTSFDCVDGVYCKQVAGVGWKGFLGTRYVWISGSSGGVSGGMDHKVHLVHLQATMMITSAN